MDFRQVTSSNVLGVHHDPETKDLHVKYKNGVIYRYRDVPVEKHSALMAADADPAQSVGSYIHNNIKGKHSHSKVDPT